MRYFYNLCHVFCPISYTCYTSLGAISHKPHSIFQIYHGDTPHSGTVHTKQLYWGSDNLHLPRGKVRQTLQLQRELILLLLVVGGDLGLDLAVLALLLLAREMADQPSLLLVVQA